MTEAEQAAVDEILAQYPGESATLSRADPGDQGSMIVQVAGDTHEVTDG